MFLVSDTPSGRAAKLKRVAALDSNVAVIVAAAHLEWTIRRAIIVLSPLPNHELRPHLAKARGLMDLKRVWANDIARGTGHPRLPVLIADWQFVNEKAWALRNRMIHGGAGAGERVALLQFHRLLEAAEVIRRYVESQGANLYRRLPVRRKPLLNF